jgi:hypothetical protein
MKYSRNRRKLTRHNRQCFCAVQTKFERPQRGCRASTRLCGDRFELHFVAYIKEATIRQCALAVPDHPRPHETSQNCALHAQHAAKSGTIDGNQRSRRTFCEIMINRAISQSTLSLSQPLAFSRFRIDSSNRILLLSCETTIKHRSSMTFKK